MLGTNAQQHVLRAHAGSQTVLTNFLLVEGSEYTGDTIQQKRACYFEHLGTPADDFQDKSVFHDIQPEHLL